MREVGGVPYLLAGTRPAPGRTRDSSSPDSGPASEDGSAVVGPRPSGPAWDWRPGPLRYVVGVDLGQTTDPTAVVVLRVLTATDPDDPAAGPVRVWSVDEAQRLPLGTPYTDVADLVLDDVAAPLLAAGGEVLLVADHTGVGRPVLDTLRERQRQRPALRHLPLWGVTITAGKATNGTGSLWTVPKVDLVGVAQVALQQRRLALAPSIGEPDVLLRELRAMRTVPKGEGVTYAAREGEHDDVVLALCCGLWAGDKRWPWGRAGQVSLWSPVGHRIGRAEPGRSPVRGLASRRPPTLGGGWWS